MKIRYLFIFSLVLFLSCTEDRVIPSNDIVIDGNSKLIHYWNFNSLAAGTLDAVAADFTLLPSLNPSITYEGTGAGYMDSFSPGYDSNARNGDAAGTGLRARNPSDTRSLILDIPTVGFQKIVVQFATARSSSNGAAQQNYSYTIDGTNYTTEGLAITSHNMDIDPLNAVVTLDFRSIETVNNNTNFKLKIDFAGDTVAGTSGNNRFDNVTVIGNDAPPANLGYLATNNFTINQAITPLSPTVVGSVSSYSVSPALPAGLALDPATGVISGTPTQLSVATNYTVTATNSTGSATFVLSIAVSAVVDNTLYLIHYWNFNTLPAGTLTTIPADASLLSTLTTTITYPGSGAGYLDQVSPGSALNSQNGAIDGLGLRARNPSDTRSLIISASTLGYKNIAVKFATDRTSSGATVQNYSYTVDGTNYITTGLATTTFSPNVDPNYDVITLDFSSIATVVNNPNFKIKIDFGGSTASGASGNNRFDNITIQGNIL